MTLIASLHGTPPIVVGRCKLFAQLFKMPLPIPGRSRLNRPLRSVGNCWFVRCSRVAYYTREVQLFDTSPTTTRNVAVTNRKRANTAASRQNTQVINPLIKSSLSVITFTT